jgi:hypothetical protein
MEMARDLTRTQYAAALAQNGIRPDAMGYYYVTTTTLVCAANGGNTRRAQLAHLLQEQRSIVARELAQKS